MALGNNNSAIYLNIADGKIVRRFQSPTANSRERVTKTSKTVHEEFYSFVEGVITDIQTRENDYGKNWMVSLKDGDESYILQMDYSSGYSSAFLKALPNVDLSSKVKLTPKMTIEGDKKRTTLFINQRGHACKHAFTKDNPNGLPQMVKIKVKGKEQWDDSDMMQFFEDMVKNKILPQLNAKKYEVVAETVTGTDDPEAGYENPDDLPF